MSKKPDTLALLTAMNQQQSQQFMAATLLAIAIVMKKNGLTELEISPNDYALLEQGETLEPIPTVAGGMIYKFVKVQPPLAKRVTPDVVKRDAGKPGWVHPRDIGGAGWYEAQFKNTPKGESVKVYFSGEKAMGRPVPGAYCTTTGEGIGSPLRLRAIADDTTPAPTKLNGKKVN